MLFFFIPICIFLISLLSIFWVIARKFVYLKKLAPETLEGTAVVQRNFWVELFPELTASLKKIKPHEWKITLLAEFEKFLRKLRLISLKIDSVTNQLIHRVRRTTIHHEETLNHLNQEAEIEKEETLIKANGEEGKDWKEKEQELIIEIAKNPKNAELYKELGNVYIRAKEWQDAAESFNKAVELDPQDTNAKIKLKQISKKIMQLSE
jgi:tetratricopeptide (TPR) repeat protein